MVSHKCMPYRYSRGKGDRVTKLLGRGQNFWPKIKRKRKWLWICNPSPPPPSPLKLRCLSTRFKDPLWRSSHS